MLLKKNLESSRPEIVALVAFLFLSLMVCLHSIKYNGDLSGFICIGDRFEHPLIGDDVLVFEKSWGYDGQFFYLAAHDPLLLENTSRFMDAPSYRSQRLAYPLLVSILSFGQPSLYPIMMVLINVMAIAIGVFYLSLFLRDNKKSPWWALALALNGGVLMSIYRDLSEPLSVCLIIMSFWYQHKNQLWFSALFLTLAVLTRESLIFIPFIIVLIDLLSLRWSRAAINAIPGGVFVIWQLYVTWRLGSIPLMSGHGNFGVPFEGMINYLDKLTSPGGVSFHLAFFLIVVTILALSVFAINRKDFKEEIYLAIPLIFFTTMAFFFSDKIWAEPWSYGRVLLPQHALLLVFLAKTNWRYERFVDVSLIASLIVMFIWIQGWMLKAFFGLIDLSFWV